MWDIIKGEKLGVITRNEEENLYCMISLKNNLLVTGSNSNLLYVYNTGEFCYKQFLAVVHEKAVSCLVNINGAFPFSPSPFAPFPPPSYISLLHPPPPKLLPFPSLTLLAFFLSFSISSLLLILSFSPPPSSKSSSSCPILPPLLSSPPPSSPSLSFPPLLPFPSPPPPLSILYSSFSKSI